MTPRRALTVLAPLLAVALAGCGGSSPNASPPASNPSTPVASPSTPGGLSVCLAELSARKW
jgi:predicted small lipoprotein YifL